MTGKNSRAQAATRNDPAYRFLAAAQHMRDSRGIGSAKQLVTGLGAAPATQETLDDIEELISLPTTP